jgi:predicted metal-dependent hydrolase
MSSTRSENTPSLSLVHRLACEEGTLHPKAIAGMRLFNTGHYFEAHEALELAWREEPGTIRDLYRGILQVAVMYHHITRRNFRGAVKVFQRCMPWLEPFPTHCHGIDIGELRQNCQQVYTELARLGPNGIKYFNLEFLKPIRFEDPSN